MRGIVTGLGTPSPFITRIPGILQEDDFLQRWLPAFDDAVAPVFSVLDNLSSYVDPRLTPVDFLDWLAAWVDVEIDEEWSEADRRELVAGASALHRRRGTLQGIGDAVQLAAGPEASVVVSDTGGTTWSTSAGAAMPGSAPAGVTVTVAVDTTDADGLRRRLERIAVAVSPAHVPCRVEIQGAAAKSTGRRAASDAEAALPDGGDDA